MANPYATLPAYRPRLAHCLAALGLLVGGIAQAQTPASFAAVTTYPTGASSYPLGVAVADVNGDGRPDIVTGNNFNNTVGVLLGQAGGSFAAVTSYSAGANSSPLGVAVADVNADGRPDIVLANQASDAAGVLLGLAGGGFAPISTYSTGVGSQPQGVAVADVNGDGRLDIVTGNYSTNTAGVLLGRASGGFATVILYATDIGPRGVTVADANGDGRLDLLTANNNNTTGVLLGLAGGGFAAVILYPTGAGSLPYRVAVADMNQDGRPDLVTANAGTNTAGVLLGLAGGGFGPISTYPTGGIFPSGVAVADVNGDGRLDIITSNSSSVTASVLLGQSSGGFATATTYAAGNGGSYSLAVADVNGDKRPDIVVANETNTVGVLLNTGTFAPLAVAASAAAAELAMFPNPAHDGFTVELPAAWAGAPVRVELLDALGRVVACPAAGSGTSLRLDTSSLVPGIYTLRLYTGGGVVARRVVLD